MNFAIDSPVPAPKPAPVNSGMDGVADMMFTRALLGAERIESSGIKNRKKSVMVRVEHVFRSRNTLYIHYSVQNLSGRPCALTQPEIVELLTSKPAIFLHNLQRRQLTEQQVGSLGEVNATPLVVAHFETQSDDLLPEHEAQGVLAVRQPIQGPTVIQLTFKLESGPRQAEAKATVVF